MKLLTDTEKGILDTDYFLVAMGSDSENVACANQIMKYVGQYHIEKFGAEGKSLPTTVIAYVVYDSDFAKILNENKSHSSLRDGKTDIYMQAVGSLEEVYSAENIFMTEFIPLAEKADMAYMNAQNKDDRKEAHDNRLKDDYKHWANIARSTHIMYRAYI